MASYENFKVEIDSDGIALVTWDMPDHAVNVLSESSIKELQAIIDSVAEDAAIKGVVITSGKKDTFCAGADLNMFNALTTKGTVEERKKLIFDAAYGSNMSHRKLETCGKPVVAALNGTALGGGLEIALVAHYRIAADNPKAQFGFPEAKVGVIPGGGGTQRLPRLIGVANALPILLQSPTMDPQKALAAGILHKVVPAADLIAEAKNWIKNGGEGVQPWDKKGYRIPGGGPYEGAATTFTMANALITKETHNNYPALRYIASCVYEGLIVPFDTGLKIESRYFTKILMDPRSKAMMRSLFLSMQELSKGARRPANVAPSQVKKLGVLGAGMMGAGIAYVSAQAGIEVILVDTDQANAEKGKAYSEKLMAKQVEKGRATEAKKTELLARIKPTTNFDDLKGVDLIIEAVFENRDVKADVTKKAEPMLAQGGVFGSNTSTLPITSLAEAAKDQSHFIGIHFFSPVDKMMLVEIIKGKNTSPETIAKAMDYVKQIRKTPIVVNDSRGFYTSRVFSTYIGEGLAMLHEGIKPAIIENVGRMTSMPMPPLALNDEVALDLTFKIQQQTKKDVGDKYVAMPGEDIVAQMVEKLGRIGKKAGKGFYDYSLDGKKHIWPGLTELAPTTKDLDDVDVEELKKRFLYRQALEAARCFEENVVVDVRDADVGAILGWGFAPWSGGPLSLIDMVGVKKFVETCDALAQKYGARFTPNALLREMAAKGESFYTRFAPEKAAA